MRKATCKVLNAAAHSSAHNSRADEPSYIIKHLSNHNYYELRYADDEFVELAKVKYVDVKKQKMQKTQIESLIKETSLSLEAHHTLQDVKNVFEELAKKYGGHFITEIAIHEDEGHFEDQYGITYYPSTDIVYIKEEQSWYRVPLERSLEIKSDKPPRYEFSEKIDINDYQFVKNRHAHVKFSMFDLNTGITGRMAKGQVSERLKVVAEVLKMKYDPETKTSSKSNIGDIKRKHRAVRNEKVANFLNNNVQIDSINLATLVKEEELKDEIKRLREALKEQNAKRADYAKLEELNKNLRNKVNNQNLTLDDMTFQLNELRSELLNKDERIEKSTETISKLKSKNELMAASNDELIAELNRLRKMTDSLKEKNKVLDDEINQLKQLFNDKRKESHLVNSADVDVDVDNRAAQEIEKYANILRKRR